MTDRPRKAAARKKAKNGGRKIPTAEKTYEKKGLQRKRLKSAISETAKSLLKRTHPYYAGGNKHRRNRDYASEKKLDGSMAFDF